jgi:hypothetical protein
MYYTCTFRDWNDDYWNIRLKYYWLFGETKFHVLLPPFASERRVLCSCHLQWGKQIAAARVRFQTEEEHC